MKSLSKNMIVGVVLLDAFVVAVLVPGCITIKLEPKPGDPEIVTNIIQVVTNAVPQEPATTNSTAALCAGTPCKGNPNHKDSHDADVRVDVISNFRAGADADEALKYSPYGKAADKWMPINGVVQKNGGAKSWRDGSDIILQLNCFTADGITYAPTGFTLESSRNPFLCPSTRPDITWYEGGSLRLRIVGGKPQKTTRGYFARIRRI